MRGPHFGLAALAVSSALSACATTSPPAEKPETLAVAWPVDSPLQIGGYRVAALGAPTVLQEGPSPALCFDGKQDGIMFPVHPFTGQQGLTVQVLFRPDAGGPKEQKVLHLQDDNGDNRVMIEARATPGGSWYLRSFIRAGEDQEQALEAKASAHQFGEWHWAAFTCGGGMVRQYVNGNEEVAAPMKIGEIKKGEMSIGVRLSREGHFKGCIRELRFANAALPPVALARDVAAPSKYIAPTRTP